MALMSGYSESKVQGVLTLDLGRFQGPRAVHVYRARTYVCTHVYSHTWRTFGTVTTGTPPGFTLTCSCTGPLVNFWRTPAISTAIVLSSVPLSLPPFSFRSPIPPPSLFVTTFVKPRTKWKIHPLTFQCLALALPLLLFFIFFSGNV